VVHLAIRASSFFALTIALFNVRSIKDAKEDLRDSVFLEVTSGMTLDLGSLRFFEGTEQEEPRVEFHFPKQIEGRSTLDPDSERIVFHCKASAKTPRLGHGNTLALRAEFHPRACAFTACPTFETEGWLAAAQHLRTACA